MQMTSSDTTHNYLHDSFISTLQRSLTSSLDRVGKGWYNLHESNHETYSFSKLKKLLTAARFMAEDTIRHLTLTSLTAFAHFMRRVCDVTAVVKSTSEVALSRGPTARRLPLLAVDLQVS
jgi:dynein heavy chain, axonemal